MHSHTNTVQSPHTSSPCHPYLALVAGGRCWLGRCTRAQSPRRRPRPTSTRLTTSITLQAQLPRAVGGSLGACTTNGRWGPGLQPQETCLAQGNRCGAPGLKPQGSDLQGSAPRASAQPRTCTWKEGVGPRLKPQGYDLSNVSFREMALAEKGPRAHGLPGVAHGRKGVRPGLKPQGFRPVSFDL